MKKMFFKIAFLLVALMSSQMLFGQSPVLQYNENGYTTSEAKTFVLGDSHLSSNYRREMLRIVNAGLVSSGEALVLGGNNISWLLDQVIYENVSLPIGYINSNKTKDNGVVFFPNSSKGFNGEVGVFVYGKCRLILFKTICMNLLEIPVSLIQTNPTVQQVAPNLPPQQQFQQQPQQPQIQYIEVPVPVEVPVYIQQEQCYEEPYYNPTPSVYVQRRVRSSRYSSCGDYGYGYGNGYSSGYGYGSPINLSLAISNSKSSNYSSNTNTVTNTNTNTNTNNQSGSYYKRRDPKTNSTTGQGSMSSGAGDYSYGGSGGEGSGRPSSSYTSGNSGGGYSRNTAVRSKVGGSNSGSGGTRVRSTVGRGN